MLPLFFLLLELLLLSKHSALRALAATCLIVHFPISNDKKPFCMASRSAIQKGFLLMVQLSTARLA